MTQVIRKPDERRRSDDFGDRIERLERLLAGDMETRVALLERDRGAFEASRTGSASPGKAANAWQTALMNTKTAESSDWFDTATGRYTPLVEGFYQLSFSLCADAVFSFGSGTFWTVGIMKNGAIYKAGGIMVHQQQVQPRANWSGLVYADGVDDFFEPGYHFNDSVAHGILGAADNCWFTGVRV